MGTGLVAGSGALSSSWLGLCILSSSFFFFTISDVQIPILLIVVWEHLTLSTLIGAGLVAGSGALSSSWLGLCLL